MAVPGAPRGGGGLKQRLSSFHGGLRVPGHKALTSESPVRGLAMPERLTLPLQQHIGEPAEPVVAPGDHVLAGQVLARRGGYVSVPLHAPTSGRVVEIAPHPVPHPSGLSAPCVVLEPDGAESAVDPEPMTDFRDRAPDVVRARIRDAGVVGMGGAGFPTFVKLNPGPERPVDTLVVNGIECEPYITCDDRLMRERPVDVVEGAKVLAHAVGAGRCIVAVEDNKPQAYAALEGLAGDGVEVVRVPTLYPAGDERLLIKVLSGREVPTEGLPADIGLVMQNVATAAAVFQAVVRGQPLTRRTVTVTGEGAGAPCNLEVPIGTGIRALLDEAQVGASPGSLVMGGSMMGFALRGADVPVVKTMNCLLVAGPEHEHAPAPVLPCIRCGECTRACPMQLLPQQLYWYARSKDFDKVQDYSLFDCVECGCCAYVCPSRIPLVQFFRFAKTEIWAAERERRKADVARARHEFRNDRLEREKRERAARHQRKRNVVRKAGAEDGGARAIKAAVERAQARHAEEDGTALGDARTRQDGD